MVTRICTNNIWGKGVSLYKLGVLFFVVIHEAVKNSLGIPRFTLLMWGFKNKTAEAKTA